MSPDAEGRFRGMVVPRVPWHEDEPPENSLAKLDAILKKLKDDGHNLSQGRRVTREQVERAAGG